MLNVKQLLSLQSRKPLHYSSRSKTGYAIDLIDLSTVKHAKNLEARCEIIKLEHWLAKLWEYNFLFCCILDIPLARTQIAAAAMQYKRVVTFTQLSLTILVWKS